MNEPLIRQWQHRPPAGGWDLNFTVKEQEFRSTKRMPYKIVEEIANVQKLNDVFVGYDAIWEYCNNIWQSRDPDRAVNPTYKEIKKATKVEATPFSMILGLAKAIAKTGKDALTGKQVASGDAETARRLSICLKCPYVLLNSKSEVRCSKCGCFMSFKARLASQKCPINKW